MNGWKCFDFGPATKQPSLISERDDKREISDKKIISKKHQSRTTRRKCFSFHDSLTPKTITELAVHPKKIKEVEDWFIQNIVCQHLEIVNTPFLLLSGPAGCGKTATVSAICNSLGISICEWINPIDQDYEIKGINQVNRFLEFLVESRWDSLFDTGKKKVTLVEDFPNALIHHPDQFTEILEECRSKTRHPVIFICSCTNASGSNASLLRTLFPDETINNFNITHISFNACAPSMLRVALKRAQTLVKENLDELKLPSPTVIDAILASAMGDVRHAMNQFYIASLIGGGDLPTVTSNDETVGAKRKRNSKVVKVEGMSKDENLGLFHGLGRILCPKRTVVGTSWKLSHNVEELIDEFSTQPNMVMSFLFENYLKYFGDIVDASRASEALSLSATFCENWGDGQETLIFALWISVLSLMIFNEHKVSKWTQIRGPTKIDKSVNRAGQAAGFNATDYFYYNLITKTDKFHRFQKNN